MPIVLMIQNKPETIFDNEQFARLLEEKLGYEAAEYFLEALDNAVENAKEKCTGECDVTYSLQEGYENILRDIRDEIGAWAIRRLTKEQLVDRRDALFEKIEKIL